jgi:quinone-modifying oxidoreductase subunit QmoB
MRSGRWLTIWRLIRNEHIDKLCYGTVILTHEVMIFGDGPCAGRIAQNLADHRIGVWLVADGPMAASAAMDRPGIHLLSDARMIECRGYAGAFELRLAQSGGILSRRVAAVALAFEENGRANVAAIGLESAIGVKVISDLERELAATPVGQLFTSQSRVALLNGWREESHPAVAARMLAVCLRLQKSKIVQTFFFTGNLKVAGDGLEALYQEAKASGTVFVKSSERIPEARSLEGGKVQIDYWEELTRQRHQLRADWVVVDESLHADPRLAYLSDVLGLEMDRTGFAQSDNVRRTSNFTNRRGIFAAGSSRAILSAQEKQNDADQAALEILKFLSDRDKEQLPRVEINPGKCARCLTCYRLCPHWAIAIGPRISVVSTACQSCGICAAGCPAQAIEVEGLPIRSTLQRVARMGQRSQDGGAVSPRLVLFCCSRSAAQAHRLASAMGFRLPPGTQVIDVPCGGAVSARDLLAALDSGADGVMLCTCHQDNCRSQLGSQHAHRRAATVVALLNLAGVPPERLQVIGVAANMGAEFVRAVEAFHCQMQALAAYGQNSREKLLADNPMDTRHLSLP